MDNKIRKALRLGGRPISCSIVRHSVDARKKPELFDMYTVDVDTGLRPKEEAALIRRLKNKNISAAPADRYVFPSGGTEKLPHRPVVIGAGPAGLFCALFLAQHGYRPLLIERGRKMEDRTADVEAFWKSGVLDPASNVQFGEGGAGTFSDGKLNTQVNDKTGRSAQVLRIFVDAGAPESILYEGKPHIGTDRLREVIPRIRRQIEEAGGEVRFETRCTGFTFEDCDSAQGRRLTGLCLRPAYAAQADRETKDEWVPAEAVVFAVGHSARDTIEELHRENIPLEQKQFAVGFRVAHPQALIDHSQYGISDREQMRSMRLSASPYKLTAKAASGHGVYSFCMCPGGYIVNASSEQGHLCVNGMSDEGRDSGWANSAIVITVGQEEFGSDHVLAGMAFQRQLEKRAWEMGAGAVPVQQYQDLRKSFLAENTNTDGSGSQIGSSQENSTEASSSQAGSSEANGMEPSFSDSALSGAEEKFTSEAVKGACRRAPLHRLLPAGLTRDFIEGMDQFGHKIRGFDGEDAVVAGIESRTSSPVRIPRGKTYESVGAAGLYPCGEGAGYAGGIMSAAMDGIRIAEAIAQRFAPVSPE